MYEHAAEYEIVYHAKTPYEVMKTKWLSFDDVLKIKQVEEMLEVYYNSGQFEITMKVMEPLFDSAFAMFQELGVFMRKRIFRHEPFKNSQSRDITGVYAGAKERGCGTANARRESDI